LSLTFYPPELLLVALQPKFRGPEGQYIVTEDHSVYDSTTGLTLVVRRGTRTDFASFPRWLWWLLKKDGPWARAALFHDDLYRRQIMSRFKSDALFRGLLEDELCPVWAQKLFFLALRIHGQAAWDANAKKRASGEWEQDLAANVKLLEENQRRC
jgi:hypothetical protein